MELQKCHFLGKYSMYAFVMYIMCVVCHSIYNLYVVFVTSKAVFFYNFQARGLLFQLIHLCGIRKCFYYVLYPFFSTASESFNTCCIHTISINSSINNKLIFAYKLSQTSLNAKLIPSISLFLSPLLKLSKSKSCPSCVISTFRSFWNTT